LDEPTNHLDIPSREALESALQSYEGTILTVSHDRFFLDEVSTQIFSFEENGRIEIFNGNYSEFHDWRDAENAKSKTQSQSAFQSSNPQFQVENQKSKTEDQRSKNQRLKVERRIKEIEIEIPRLEEDLAKLTLQMNASEIVSSHEKLHKVSEKYEQTEKQIKSLYAEWENLLETVE
jgi:ATP-binding cassette subfamily F protein 3